MLPDQCCLSSSLLWSKESPLHVGMLFGLLLHEQSVPLVFRFLPAVLTAVLSHHIGWVNTVKDASLRKSLTDSVLEYSAQESDGSLADESSQLCSALSSGHLASTDSLQQQMRLVGFRIAWVISCSLRV